MGFVKAMPEKTDVLSTASSICMRGSHVRSLDMVTLRTWTSLPPMV
jgi:hypothetical protein